MGLALYLLSILLTNVYSHPTIELRKPLLSSATKQAKCLADWEWVLVGGIPSK